jgi:hypothetical protein
MTCVEVRDRLTEHALGVLTPEDAGAVDRHLQWCAGCRKESAELQEGLASMTLALPPAEPHPSLEQRVVDRVAEAVGRRKPLPRRRGRRLAVVAVAAAVVSLVSTTWAFSERIHSDDLLRSAQKRVKTVTNAFARLNGGRPYQARLEPVSDNQGFGTAVIVSAPNRDDLVLVDVLPPSPDTGPYTVRLQTRSGRVVDAGQLKATTGGDLFFWELTGHDLSQVHLVTIVNRSGWAVMTGVMHPYNRDG